MRDMILAMRAIWDAWLNGSKLEYRGEFYKHTLMTPFFDPGPLECGPPKVFLAAVGELMTEVAGEVVIGEEAAQGLDEAGLVGNGEKSALDSGHDGNRC